MKNILIIAFGLFVLSACQPQTDSLSESAKPCQLAELKCQFSNQQGPIEVQFKQTPIAEESMEIQFVTPDGVDIKHAVIAGVSMDMGVAKVQIDDNNLGKVFLPACHTKQMDWQMDVYLDNQNEPLSLQFSILNPDGVDTMHDQHKGQHSK